ncbi:MAG: ATP synthase F1 subunit gamma [Candidatus Andersenbacteria bacterium]
MSKVHVIRRRIKSVKSINQITKAMEMVAASKLRRAQEATLRSRLYSVAAREALAMLRQRTGSAQHPLFEERPVKSRLIILFSSDRGLAGAYNSNLFRALVDVLKEAGDTTTKLIVIGQKGAQFASKLAGQIEVTGAYTNWPVEPSTKDLHPITATAVSLFTEQAVDEVSVLYTDFISSVRQVVKKQIILPVVPADILPPEAVAVAQADDVLFEPSPQEVLDYIVPRFVETQIYQANLEAIASEQIMRMMAMKNASDNAKDIIEDLTLTYNGARQAAITQELAEISAGAQAIS